MCLSVNTQCFSFEQDKEAVKTWYAKLLLAFNGESSLIHVLALIELEILPSPLLLSEKTFLKTAELHT
jgi:hypothetical protein